MDTAPDRTATTLATWIYLLRCQGVPIADAAVDAGCAAVDHGGDAGAPALVAAVRAQLAGPRFDDVAAALRAVIGGAVVADFGAGENAEARAGALRRATFGDNRPWLASIADRRDGVLEEHLVLVSAYADTVTLMDPDPWDDVPEERSLPLPEFLVRWELAGARAVRVS